MDGEDDDDETDANESTSLKATSNKVELIYKEHHITSHAVK